MTASAQQKVVDFKEATISGMTRHYYLALEEIPSLGDNSSVLTKEQFYPTLSSEARAALSRLERFTRFTDNWDTYGAKAPSGFAIKNARQFIRRVDHDSISVYFTSPGVNGEIMVEFKGNSAKAAEVYFNPDNSNEILLFENNECIDEGNIQRDYARFKAFVTE
jgi:hypothetical protein